MDRGLDELIESLLTEIAFSGTRGCSVSNYLAVIDSFYTNDQGTAGHSTTEPVKEEQPVRHGNGRPADSSSGTEAQLDVRDQGFGIAAKVWRWLIARPDVSVGIDREFNHLTLEEVLAIPEQAEPTLPVAIPESSKTQTPSAVTGQRNAGRDVDNDRPRLHVSEERLWKTITGHGLDLKRVPLFEWKALVDIASVKEKGIVQGDLVRLSGQDKRSLPTRTDSLAKKGYIIKQPIILRGCRSSKLWLARFAQNAKADADSEGLKLDELDLSKETLTRDLDPVPFSDKWIGNKIDYLAIAQAFVAVTKAWGLIRYCDVRVKMDVEERVPPMRALAKTSRWLTNIGVVTFVAARFPGSYKLFKDCVKFLREPTPAEWKAFRTTPKARLQIPSQRVGKRGAASRARHEAARQNPNRRKGKKLKKPSEEVTPSLWSSQKPFPNTVLEIIKRSGDEGTSNTTITRQTLGHDFRKYSAALTGAISIPNSQPPHLERFAVNSQIVRVGKTRTYKFAVSNGTTASEPANEDSVQAQTPHAKEDTGEAVLSTSGGAEDAHMLSQPAHSKFVPGTSTSLSQISQGAPQSKFRKYSKPSNPKAGGKRKRGLDDVPLENSMRSLPKRQRQPPKTEFPLVSIPADEEFTEDLASSASRQDISPLEQPQQTADESPQPKRPGVYRGPNNLLDPVHKRKGRPRNSYVLIFRFDALKNPSFLGVGGDKSGKDHVETSPAGQEPPVALEVASVLPSIPAPTASGEDASLSAEANTTPTNGTPTNAHGKPRRGRGDPFKCDKCGGTWKHIHGLEYHLNKSRTICNPNFTPLPAKPPTRPKLVPEPGKSESRRKARGHEGINAQPPRILPRLPSKRVRPVETPNVTSPSTPKPAQSTFPRSSILLQDVQAYDVTDRISDRRASLKAQNMASPVAQKGDGLLLGSTAPDPSTERATHHDQVDKNVLEGSQMQWADSNTAMARPAGGLQQQVMEPVIEPLLVSGVHVNSVVEEALPVVANFEASGASVNPLIPESATGSSLSQIKSDPDATASIPHPLPTVVDSAVIGQDSLAEPVRQRRALPTSGSRTNQDTAPSVQPSESRSLASFARPTRKNASAGSLRKSRTSQIIEYLLDQSNGVFPGNRSVFLAVLSVWIKEFTDVGPPDRKICQGVVNQLQKDEVLKQLHFGFVDESGYFQQCTVLARVQGGERGTADASIQTRIDAMKEKMREMFPAIYVPAAFSLSEEEAKLFNALEPGDQRHNASARLRGSDAVQTIETLQYPMPVMVDIPVNAHASKRSAEASGEIQDAQPAKRVRVDVHGVEKPQAARRPRKPKEAREWWDSGKLGLYLWEKSLQTESQWDKAAPCLQDPATGAWSWRPDTDIPLEPRLKAILSSVKRTKEVDAPVRPPRRPYPKNRKSRNTWQAARVSSPEEEPSGDEEGGEDVEEEESMQVGEEVAEDEVMTDLDANTTVAAAAIATAIAPATSTSGEPATNQFIAPSTTSAHFAHDDLASDDEEEEEDTVMESCLQTNEENDDESGHPSASGIRFAPVQPIQATGHGGWPGLANADFEDTSTGFTIVGSMPCTQWLRKENLPQDVEDIIRHVKGRKWFKSWADPLYGEFLRNTKEVAKWEQSVEGTQILTNTAIAPHYIFMDFTVDESKANMKPITPEWLSLTQYTAENLPDEIKNISEEDHDYALSPNIPRKNKAETQPETQPKAKRAYNRRAQIIRTEPKPRKQLTQAVPPKDRRRNTQIAKPITGVEYKTRSLTLIPRQARGRFNKPRAHERLGVNQETELIAAFVVIRTLIGGVDRTADLGLIMKNFPEMSLSALRKFWPKVCRERTTYIDALIAKFQSSYLEAYEKGEIPPLDYDNIEGYDWRSLIMWTAKLETHENVDLPGSRQALLEAHVLDNPADEVVDWREVWFSQTSVYSRIEATAGETITIPLLPLPTSTDGETTLKRARSWVRSLCFTRLRGVNAPTKIMKRLLELTDQDYDSTMELVEVAKAKLMSDKVITRTKGKSDGQNFKLNSNFAKQLEKMSRGEKLTQATAFKTQLDQSFRNDQEFILPYASDDGTIMAVMNLQACGRIRIEAPDIPDIPFGFEPGNYEGRHFPKSYYHFKVKLLPNETYMFDDDMPLLQQANIMAIPTQGPNGELPIWVDLFGKVDKARWAEFVGMVVFILATKGPVTAESATILLKPVIEEFESKLIIDWLEKFGLLRCVEEGRGVSIGEWWWLVAGKAL
ncbi:Uu.00g084230.m01.CDS01 [Anthostomella pinea]|uniref:Uu.00g084230.m01.CDS01 n=1 Tax=Anthostomella pinea TaxID=933095 RepID=A0AAI8VMC7_9PEZI|nr:Uu.00g084230.m01.CDS01 [Anthostomella pinea]